MKKIKLFKKINTIISLIIALLITVSLPVFSACNIGIEQLDSPTRLALDEIAMVLHWREVPYSTGGYRVSINGQIHYAQYPYSPHNPWFSLARLTPGTRYYIRVQALTIDDNFFRNSEWSDYFVVERDDPRGLELAAINGYTEYIVAGIGTAAGSIVIPDTHNGLPVTQIASGAFRLSAGISSVVIGNNVHTIGARAFEDALNLTSITFGNSVRYIQDRAFFRARNLTGLSFPDSLISIGSNAFTLNTALTSVVFGDSLEVIGESAFLQANNLTSIVFPDSLTRIERLAFRDTTRLINVRFPGNLSYLGFESFRNSGIESVKIPSADNLTIGEAAFAVTPNLDTLVLGEGVVSIGRNAFHTAMSLENITLADSIQRIFAGAFLNSYVWRNTSEGFVMADNWIVDFRILPPLPPKECGECEDDEDCKECEEVPEPEPIDLIIPQNTIGIADYTFRNISRLRRVTIAENVRIIGRAAFADCVNLEAVEVLGNALESIGHSAFIRNQRLTEMNIPDSVRQIRPSAFAHTGLWASGTVANGMVYVGNWLVGNVLREGSDGSRFTIPMLALRYNTVGIADNALNRVQADIIQVDFGRYLRYVGDNALANNAVLDLIDFPDTTISLGEGAFSRNTAMRSANLGSVTRIEDFTFFRNHSLLWVTVSNDLTHIGNHAFSDARMLSTLAIGEHDWDNTGMVTIGDNVEFVGDSAFLGATAVSRVVLSDNLRAISNNAFRNTRNLTRVDFGNDSILEVIGDNAFRGAVRLGYDINNPFVLPNSVRQIGSGAFRGTENLTDLVIPAGITRIEFETFRDSVALESIVMLGDIVYIGSYAFFGATALYNIVIPNSVKHIGDQAFRNNASLGSINIPNSVIRMGSHVFTGANTVNIIIDKARAPLSWHIDWNWNNPALNVQWVH